eukprot:1801299-Rhodomonas_salina.1
MSLISQCTSPPPLFFPPSLRPIRVTCPRQLPARPLLQAPITAYVRTGHRIASVLQDTGQVVPPSAPASAGGWASAAALACDPPAPRVRPALTSRAQTSRALTSRAQTSRALTSRAQAAGPKDRVFFRFFSPNTKNTRTGSSSSIDNKEKEEASL